MIPSPYSGSPGPDWLDITRRLIAEHPIPLSEWRSACLMTWERLWQTTVGQGPLAVQLDTLDVPASVVGYFFEVLLARELGHRHPLAWRGNETKQEKDLVCLTDLSKSVEVKSSGQLGFKVFGNRSHSQKAKDESQVKPEKSGYYLTLNFFGRTLTLLQFGWIDIEDWVGQGSQTGQMAALKTEVYDFKILPIPGAYRQAGPVRLLSGVGPKMQDDLAAFGVITIGDLIAKRATLPAKLAKIAQGNAPFLADCHDPVD